jgi:hypothetical protein
MASQRDIKAPHLFLLEVDNSVFSMPAGPNGDHLTVTSIHCSARATFFLARTSLRRREDIPCPASSELAERSEPEDAGQENNNNQFSILTLFPTLLS